MIDIRKVLNTDPCREKTNLFWKKKLMTIAME
jgi:hypothetical protein